MLSKLIGLWPSSGFCTFAKFIALALVGLLSACSQPSECEQLVAKSSFEAAVAKCSAEVEQGGSPTSILNLITSLAEQGDFDQLVVTVSLLENELEQAAAMLRSGPYLKKAGRLEQAQSYLDNAVAVYRKVGHKEKLAQALHEYFGVRWLQSNHQEAIKLAQEMLIVCKKLGDVDGEIKALRHLFTVFEEMGNLGPAQFAINLIEDKLGDDKTSKNWINTYISQGLLHMSNERFGLAAHQFELALKAAEGLNSRYANRIINLNIVYANLELKRIGQVNEHLKLAWQNKREDGKALFALLYYQARAELLENSYSESISTMNKALASPDLPKVWRWEMHYWLAKAAQGAGNKTLAMQSYEKAVHELEGLRRDAGFDSIKAHLLSRKRKAYESLFISYYSAGRMQDAVNVVEAVKSRSFIDAFVQNSEVAPSYNATKNSQKVFEIAAQRIDGLESYLSSMQLSDTVTDMDTETLQSNLQGKLLLSYFIAENRIFVVRFLRNGSLEIQELDLTAPQLGQLVFEYNENRSSLGLLSQLGEALLPTMLRPEKGEHMYISPDGAIAKIALASLRIDDAFLIERNSLSLIPSATSLAKIISSRPERAVGLARTSVVIADPQNNLPSALKEGNSVAELLQVSALTGLNARLSGLLANSSPSVLHIASHSGVDHLGPWLQLADQKVSGLDLLQMDIRADFVVLASCASAAQYDQYFWGSLAGVMLSNGTPSVMASLWSVNDAAMLEQMKWFYSYYTKSGSASEALARTQRRAIAEGISTVDWAAVTLLGIAN